MQDVKVIVFNHLTSGIEFIIIHLGKNVQEVKIVRKTCPPPPPPPPVILNKLVKIKISWTESCLYNKYNNNRMFAQYLD